MESAILQMNNVIPFHTTDWDCVTQTDHPGESGSAQWRTLQLGSLRIRRVTYSPGYKADHWCTKGHILYCLEGELVTELNDGRQFLLTKGMSYQVSDDMSAHRSITTSGATLLIVDGSFLKNEKEIVRNPWRM